MPLNYFVLKPSVRIMFYVATADCNLEVICEYKNNSYPVSATNYRQIKIV